MYKSIITTGSWKNLKPCVNSVDSILTISKPEQKHVHRFWSEVYFLWWQSLRGAAWQKETRQDCPLWFSCFLCTLWKKWKASRRRVVLFKEPTSYFRGCQLTIHRTSWPIIFSSCTPCTFQVSLLRQPIRQTLTRFSTKLENETRIASFR